VINHGTIILDGTLSELQQMIGLPSLIRIQYKESPQVRPFPLIEKVVENHHEIMIYYDRKQASAPPILAEAAEWGEILDIQMIEPEIEEIIGRIYQG
jgi:ABC-2 type transport system ATP-binding protein